MKGDFTRDTFDSSNHFSRVLMQQGRVQLDADWNEQTAILLHYLRTLAKDILGPHAGPAGELGFEIITRDMPDAAARVDAMESDEERRKVLKEAIQGGNALIGPGRYYVNGLLVENERPVLYTEQLGYPMFDDRSKLDAIKQWKSGLLVYVDVWERHITYVEDDHIRETALGGPDTCSRAQVAWQVKVLLQSNEMSNFDCNSASMLPALGTGKLRARARLDKPPTELCVISPESRYRGAENQLYRVEVHRGGTATDHQTGATFKWSRNNGAVTFQIRMLAGITATLEHLGRDRHLTLKPGDWVEVVDDHIAMGETAGPLAQVDQVNRDDLTVTFKLPAGLSALPNYSEADMDKKHPLLRRWDHQGDMKAFGGALRIIEQDDTEKGLQSGWINLEDGVQVWFANGGQYRIGDYWLIPARVATGNVEWPYEIDAIGATKSDSDGNPIAAAVPPHGSPHYYAPLMLMQALSDTNKRMRQDCRCRIVHLPCADYRYAFDGMGIGPNF
jgi:hypothetical protein